jgi:hypothetical protein
MNTFEIAFSVAAISTMDIERKKTDDAHFRLLLRFWLATVGAEYA